MVTVNTGGDTPCTQNIYAAGNINLRISGHSKPWNSERSLLVCHSAHLAFMLPEVYSMLTGTQRPYKYSPFSSFSSSQYALHQCLIRVHSGTLTIDERHPHHLKLSRVSPPCYLQAHPQTNISRAASTTNKSRSRLLPGLTLKTSTASTRKAL